MSYGLSGAHRTGKTTLAKAFSEATKVPFLETSTSAIMKEHGFDPMLDYPLSDRIHIQNKILDGMEALYRSGPEIFITDRTPLDAAAYMLADITRAPSMQDIEVMRYIGRCIEVTNEFFSTILVLQTGIPLIHAEGKAPSSPAYVEHIGLIVMGLVNDERLGSRHFFVPKRYLTLEDRVSCLKWAINRAQEKSGVEIEQFLLNGGHLH